MTTNPQTDTVHGCPPDGSGLTPCCGRTPFELPLTDRISSEAPITCRGAAAAPAPAPTDEVAEAEERTARYLFDQDWTRTLDVDAARKLLAAVLPAPADRAAILREAASAIESHTWNDGCAGVGCCADTPLAAAALLCHRADEATAEHHTVDGVRHLCHADDHYCPPASGSSRVADETQAERAHRCGNCEGVDPGTCLMNPDRPPEQCPRDEFDGYGRQCQKPVGHNLCSFEDQPAVVSQPDGEAWFGMPGCTCKPWTVEDGQPRYLEPHETVDKVSGWARRPDCPHHQPAEDPS